MPPGYQIVHGKRRQVLGCRKNMSMLMGDMSWLAESKCWNFERKAIFRAAKNAKAQAIKMVAFHLAWQPDYARFGIVCPLSVLSSAAGLQRGRVCWAGKETTRPQNLVVACANPNFSFPCRCRPMLFLVFKTIGENLVEWFREGSVRRFGRTVESGGEVGSMVRWYCRRLVSRGTEAEVLRVLQTGVSSFLQHWLGVWTRPMPLQDASWYSNAFQAGSLLLPLPLPRRQCRYRNAFQAGSLLLPLPLLASSVGTGSRSFVLPRWSGRRGQRECGAASIVGVT